MNNIIEEPHLELISAHREANDWFRRSLKGGNLIMSAGILALGTETQTRILDAIRTFDNFDCSDPIDDHSLGDVETAIAQPGAEPNTVLVFFKVTRCQADGKAALTLSLADEWWGCQDAVSPRAGEQCDD